MPKVKKHSAADGTYHLHFMCPACKEIHGINQTWDFNEDYEAPSISPSIRVTGCELNENNETVETICHTWITKGKVKFFPDCSHEMAGQKWIDLPEL